MKKGPVADRECNKQVCEERSRGGATVEGAQNGSQDQVDHYISENKYREGIEFSLKGCYQLPYRQSEVHCGEHLSQFVERLLGS